MKMRFASISFFSIWLLISCLPQASNLKIDPIQQSQENWCWAASLAMISHYIHQTDFADCEVASFYDLKSGGLGRCCAGDKSCNTGRNLEDLFTLMTDVLDLQYRFYARNLSFSEVQYYIHNRNPILAIVSRLNGGHLVIISGFHQQQMLHVLDPEKGEIAISHKSMLQNPWLGKWVGSIIITSRPEEHPLRYAGTD